MNYSIRDIAKMAGVSIGTVSRVLNNAGNVDESIRSRTLEIIRSVDYKAASRGRRTGTVRARSSSAGKNRTLALLSPGMSSEWRGNDLWMSYFSGIERACKERGYQLMIYMADSSSGEGDLLKDILRKCDGVLLKFERRFPDYVKRLITHLPVAGFGAGASGEPFPQVVLNNSLAGRMITEKLIELGHSRIAFINHVPRNPIFIERSNGYVEVMKEYGFCDPALLLEKEYEASSDDSGRPEAMPPQFTAEAHLLASMPEPPSAVVVANDWGALGFMRSCAAAGISVPDVFSVAGIDDAGSWGRFCVPSLSTVSMAFGRCAYFAACILCDMIEGVGTYKRNVSSIIYLPGEVNIRASVQNRRKEGAAV